MASGGSKTAVAAALGGNTLLTIIKFAAYFFTGSGAMLSEAIHTLADVFNQALLLIGVTRSVKEADERYQYGYGRESFIWALISAVGIFFLGCGVTVYHGINSLLHPHEVGDLTWAIVVLVISFLMDGAVLTVAYRELKKAAGDTPFIKYLNTGADPSAVAVLLEDLAACSGVLIALVAIMLTKMTGQLYWDAVGSILVGLLLGLVAIWLISRNRSLLVGPAIPREAQEKVIQVLKANPAVASIAELKSKQLDTHTWDVMASLTFHPEVLARKAEPNAAQAMQKLGTPEQLERYLNTYTQALLSTLGREIDVLEVEVLKVVPEVKHLDVEPH